VTKTYGVTTHATKGHPEVFYEILRDQAARTLLWQAASQGYTQTGPVRQEFKDETFIDEETGETFEIYNLYSWVQVDSIVDIAEGILTNE